MKLTEDDYLNIFVALECTINLHKKDIDFITPLKKSSNKIHPKAFPEFYTDGVLREEYI